MTAFRRAAALAAVPLFMVVLVAGPAAAATTTINVVAQSSGVIAVPSNTNVSLGDSVGLANAGNINTDESFQLFSGGQCNPDVSPFYGNIGIGQLDVLGTFSSPTYSDGQVLTF